MIAARLLALQFRISTDRDTVSKLSKAKAVLMQDLLTGKVRVNVDETEEATANT